VEQELLNLPEQVKFVDKSLKDNLINLVNDMWSRNCLTFRSR
jgi:hypothetical protein